jgi:uncharacterized circularly permuted ATP-grasp superfamily protein
VGSINIGKWQKYRTLLQDFALVSYLPETAVLSEQSLNDFLDRHQKVVLKPDKGAGGAGIFVVRTVSANRYELQYHRRKRVFASKRRLFLHLCGTITVRRYIVQQFVSLARAYGRLFDLRIMVQRGGSQSWEVTGGLAKLANRGYAVTNPEYDVYPIKRVLQSSTLPSHSRLELRDQINRICLLAADRLGAAYPSLRIIGFDIGVDVNGHIWILEPNFRPAIYWFKQLPERRTYRNIIACKRKYRRTDAATANEWIDEYYYYS